MTQNEFNVVLEQQYRKCADMLAHKKKEYTGDRIDRLNAFKIAASLQGCTPKAALAGMMSKHVVSLYDMCYSSLLQFDFFSLYKFMYIFALLVFKHIYFFQWSLH